MIRRRKKAGFWKIGEAGTEPGLVIKLGKRLLAMASLVTEPVYKLTCPLFFWLSRSGLGEELWCIARKNSNVKWNG